MKKLLVIILIILHYQLIFPESIWDDRAKDIYSRKIYYNIGDSIHILIEENSNIQYRASNSSLKNFNFNMSGGELTGLFEFIPEGNAEENKNGQVRDDFSITTDLHGRVTRVQNNVITVTASKRISIDNKTSIVQVNGDVYVADIQENMVYFNNMINPVLRITTLIENVNEILTRRDIEKVILNPDATSDIIEEDRLSEDKKMEILVDYFNKVLNVIF